ncbi:hypothetical protein FOY91_13410 [Sphingomonas solaris]|uniref:EF-hand domain-containing protein n=2 Tax=Alterirhizorhabdus solaris TaxID=2529389 RepID=A0A558R0G4_9SPHN|nr:hypothetical protein FOY91_13410 [Sphingomonas solaris]
MGQPFRAAADAADPAGAWFAQADADRDGRITPAEFAADADRFFTTLDTDRDGELIPAEVSAYERNVAPEIRLYAPRAPGPLRAPTRKERKAAGEYGMPLGAGRWSFLNIPEPVAAADADFNRGVTRAEFAAAAADRFRQIDAAQAGGKRGTLDPATLPKTPAQAAVTACDPTRVAPPPKRPR